MHPLHRFSSNLRTQRKGDRLYSSGKGVPASVDLLSVFLIVSECSTVKEFSTMKISLALCLVAFAAVNAAPQQQPEDSTKPEPYEYNYKVEDAEKSLYFGKTESGNEAGRVEGVYYVWLPDGRLMTVSYYVDKDSGFVPKITFQDNANPIGQPAPGPTSRR